MNINILVIEDNLPDFVIIQNLLKEASLSHTLYHTDTFYQGLDAISESQIDLTLLDLSLKDSVGFNTLKKYLNEAPHVPVIVMTGNKNEVVGIQSVRAGAQDFLIKGEFDGRSLAKSIRYALHRFKTHEKIKKAAEQLSMSEKRTQYAHEMAKFGNYEMDIVNNSMKWTDEMYRIFGFQPQSISPSFSDYLDYVHTEDREKVECFFEEAIKDGKLHKLIHRIVVDGTNIKHLSIQAKVNYDEFTNRIYLLGGVQDITERKPTVLPPKRESPSDKTSRIKEEVLSELSFNIRTPLSSIVTLLYLLENTELSGKQKELIEGLKTSVDDLSVVLNNLLNFSLLINNNMTLEEEELSVRTFFKIIEKVSKIKAEQSDIDLQFHIEPDFPEKIIGDPQKISQLLYNMIDSALECSDKKREIKVEIRARIMGDRQMDLHIVLNYKGRRMDLVNPKSLAETGKILELFSKDKKYKFNLTIIEKLSKSMKGEFHIHNLAGKGNRLELEIPVSLPKPFAEIKLNKPQGPLSILLVEDHALNQIATTKALTAWSDQVHVEIAADGMEGLKKFKKNHYDLILMDLQMPVMNGTEAAIQIRTKSNVSIIALTANASTEEQEKCLSVGINDYLAKPFKPKELYAKILKLIGQPSSDS